MHGVGLVLGLTNASGPWYLWWSGMFGDLSIFAAMVIFYKKHTCHEPSCWRIAKYPVVGTPFTACHKHHPEMYGKPAKGHMTQAFHRARINAIREHAGLRHAQPDDCGRDSGPAGTSAAP